MNDKFILLTTTENNPVIIGLSSISSIETFNYKNEKPKTSIILNFTVGSSGSSPKTIYVTETFDQIKTMLGL